MEKMDKSQVIEIHNRAFQEACAALHKVRVALNDFHRSLWFHGFDDGIDNAGDMADIYALLDALEERMEKQHNEEMKGEENGKRWSS